MTFDEVRPFLKVAGVVLGFVILGLFARCMWGGGSTPAQRACNDLAMDKINPCLKQAAACHGSEDETRACIDKVVAAMK